MRKIVLPLLSVLFMTSGVFAQTVADSIVYTKTRTSVYTIKPGVDIPIVAAGILWDSYGFSQVSKKDGLTEAQVLAKQKSDIPFYDRWAVHPYSHSIDQLSYIPFYVAAPLPLAVFGIDRRMRKDFWKLTYLYGEAMILTGALYTSAVHYVKRSRPLVYESSSPMETRRTSNSQNSFFAGHVALVGTSVFFIAQAYADYHPESKYKWAFYTGAGVITGLTAYWRNLAGEHFPSDIALGTVVGVASGILTPILHRTKLMRNSKLSILPVSSVGRGMAVLYKF
ncbi:MAG TPA: phosphatase PAP2 family protein [Puia sp.]|jgi:membrane-associated phospholipid phosphatase